MSEKTCCYMLEAGGYTVYYTRQLDYSDGQQCRDCAVLAGRAQQLQDTRRQLRKSLGMARQRISTLKIKLCSLLEAYKAVDEFRMLVNAYGAMYFYNAEDAEYLDYGNLYQELFLAYQRNALLMKQLNIATGDETLDQQMKALSQDNQRVADEIQKQQEQLIYLKKGLKNVEAQNATLINMQVRTKFDLDYQHNEYFTLQSYAEGLSSYVQADDDAIKTLLNQEEKVIMSLELLAEEEQELDREIAKKAQIVKQQENKVQATQRQIDRIDEELDKMSNVSGLLNSIGVK